MRLVLCAIALASTTALAHAQGAGLTLPAGTAQATVTLEVDASAEQMADTTSLAPDLAFGVTDDVTVSLVHSTYGRTGFRGAAGAGLCMTSTCTSTYDSVGAEAWFALRRGRVALAATAGVYATSFDRDFYAAKLGARARFVSGRFTLNALPAITVAASERDAMAPNRDRLWLPFAGTFTVLPGLAVGAASGLKAPLDSTFADSFEIAAGLVASYVYSPALAVGASWIHGKLVSGDMARPPGTDGFDSRAFHVWLTATR